MGPQMTEVQTAAMELLYARFARLRDRRMVLFRVFRYRMIFRKMKNLM